MKAKRHIGRSDRVHVPWEWVIAVLLVLAFYFADSFLPRAHAEPIPYPVGGGWMTCPAGYLIHRGHCYEEAPEGPVVEWGCTTWAEPGHPWIVKAQVCPPPGRPFIGNVGSVGAPLGGFSGFGVGR